MVPQVPTSGKDGEHPATYLPCGDDNREWETFFQELLQGKISNCWTRQEWQSGRGRVHQLLPRRLELKVAALRARLRRMTAAHCVIKCIRANLLLGWLSRRFPTRTIYLTRHPCAVVGSRLALQWSDVLGEVISQPRLVADYLTPFMPLIQSAATPLQRMTVHWCIENLVPLSQLAANPDWIALSYESCVAQADGTFAKLFEQLGLSPSASTAAKMKAKPPKGEGGEARSWHYPLSPAQGEEVLDICRGFGIGLYGPDHLPLCEHRAAIG
jgi:hypothetical protein